MILIIIKISVNFAWIFSKNYQSFEKLHQTLERVFHHIAKHLEVRYRTTLRLFFLTHFYSITILEYTCRLVLL